MPHKAVPWILIMVVGIVLVAIRRRRGRAGNTGMDWNENNDIRELEELIASSAEVRKREYSAGELLREMPEEQTGSLQTPAAEAKWEEQVWKRFREMSEEEQTRLLFRNARSNPLPSEALRTRRWTEIFPNGSVGREQDGRDVVMSFRWTRTKEYLTVQEEGKEEKRLSVAFNEEEGLAYVELFDVQEDRYYTTSDFWEFSSEVLSEMKDGPLTEENSYEAKEIPGWAKKVWEVYDSLPEKRRVELVMETGLNFSAEVILRGGVGEDKLCYLELCLGEEKSYHCFNLGQHGWGLFDLLPREVWEYPKGATREIRFDDGYGEELVWRFTERDGIVYLQPPGFSHGYYLTRGAYRKKMSDQNFYLD